MVRHEVLPNGLRLLVCEMRAAPVVALNLWVGSGSANDPERLPGLSHFLEHLLFKGVRDDVVVDVAREVQEAGGYLNAETGYDYTVYHQIVPSERWSDVLEAQAAALSFPAFDSGVVETERAVIIDEARGAESDPSVFVWRRLMELAFDRHPYGRPIVGTADSLASITVSDLRTHHHRDYVSDSIVQVIAGDIDADDAVARARACLSGVRSGRSPLCPVVGEARGGGLRALQYEGSHGQPYVAAAFRAPNALHEDMPVLDALSGLLGVGRSSRLRRTLRTSQGLVSDVGAGVAAYLSAGLVVVRAVAATRDVDAVLRGVFREIERVRCERPSSTEMEKNLRRLESGYVLAHETADSIAHDLGFFETLGDSSYAEEYVDRLAAVTAEDIVTAARKYLVPDRATIVCYVPGRRGAQAVDRSDDVAEAFRKAVSASIAAHESPSRWAPSSFARPSLLRESSQLRTSRTTLDGRGTMIVSESRALPIVSVALAFPGGFVEEPDGQHGITYLMQKMGMLGTAVRSADQIADEIEGLGTGISSAVDRDGFGLGLTVVSKHMREAVSVLGDVVDNPSFPAGRLAAAKAEVLAEIGEIEDHPMQRAMLLLLPLVFPGSTYGRPIRGTRESMEGIGLDDVSRWHERVCAERRLIACAVGDASADVVSAIIDESLASREREGAPRSWGNDRHDSIARTVESRPGGDAEEYAPESGQSVLVIGLAGPSAGTRESVVSRLINGALSMMGGRLWRALRERPPYAYHVGAMQAAYRQGGATIGYATSSPGGEAEAADALLSEFGRLARNGLEGIELERARRHVAGTLEISLMRGAARAAAYAMTEVTGAGYEHAQSMPSAVRSVTSDEVIEVARRYFDPDCGFAKVVLRGGAPRG